MHNLHTNTRIRTRYYTMTSSRRIVDRVRRLTSHFQKRRSRTRYWLLGMLPLANVHSRFKLHSWNAGACLEAVRRELRRELEVFQTFEKWAAAVFIASPAGLHVWYELICTRRSHSMLFGSSRSYRSFMQVCLKFILVSMHKLLVKILWFLLSYYSQLLVLTEWLFLKLYRIFVEHCPWVDRCTKPMLILLLSVSKSFVSIRGR